MNIKFLYCFIFVVFVFIDCAKSQTISFQKIEYASFDVNSYRTKKKDSAYIGIYYTISKDGLIEANDKDDYHKTHTYYSLQLTKSEIEKLNYIFNKGKKLKNYITNTKLAENEFFAGSYDFFRVTYSDGTVDSLCTIASFMTKEFNSAYDFLNNALYERKNKIIKNLTFLISLKTL